MPDPIHRFRSLDAIPAPDLWPAIQVHARRQSEAAAGRLGGTTQRWTIGRAQVPALRRLPLAAAGIAAVIVAGILLVARPSSALAVIEEARASFAAIPPFRATIDARTSSEVIAAEDPSYDGPDVLATWRVSYAGPRAWRRDVLRQEPSLPAGFGLGDAGSFEVWDGTELGIYRAETNRFDRRPAAAGFEPLGELDWASQESWADLCSDSELLADAHVAGRAARHVRCGERDLWIDAETGLMLKSISSTFSQEITEVDYGVTFAPDTFRVSAPSGATQGEEPTPPPAARLVPGEEAPGWSAPLLGGGTLQLEDLRERPTLVFFWADWCDDACGNVFPAFEEIAAETTSRAHFVSVDYLGSSAAADAWLDDALGSAERTSLIVIDDGAIGDAWGVTAVPVWVLLDKDGRFIEARAGRQSADDLRALVARAFP